MKYEVGSFVLTAHGLQNHFLNFDSMNMILLLLVFVLFFLFFVHKMFCFVFFFCKKKRETIKIISVKIKKQTQAGAHDFLSRQTSDWLCSYRKGDLKKVKGAIVEWAKDEVPPFLFDTLNLDTLLNYKSTLNIIRITVYSIL